MLCPDCSKPDTLLISSKTINKSGKSSIIRKRHCLCGYEFETVEIPKKIFKKRKIDGRTKWANYRFKKYVEERFIGFVYDIVNLKLGVPLTSNNFKIIKENRKNKLVLTHIKKDKVVRKKILLRPRVITLNQILIYKEYWEARYKFNNYPIEDKDSPNQVKIEKREYEKSIVNHLRKNKKYNNKEFMISCFDKNSKNYEWVKNIFENSNKFWDIWQKIL